MNWSDLNIKLLVLMLLAVSGQVSGYEGESVDESYFVSYTHPQYHNDNSLEQTVPKSSWNSIAFQSMDERHKCQLSLDDDGLGQYGIQHVGDLVWLSIPDQGIEGVYAVIDIRSLKPPKIPSSDEINGVKRTYITIVQDMGQNVGKLQDHSTDTNILTMIFDVTAGSPIINNAFPGIP